MSMAIPTRMRRQTAAWVLTAALILVVPLVASPDSTRAVIASKHNLSVSGPGPVTSSKTDACIFCHTPHLSDVNTKPLWNHALSNQAYNLTYTSTTYNAGASTPAAGSSKLCLSCHDGTIALGLTNSEGLISTSGSMGAAAVLGADFTNDHPVAIQPVDDGQLHVNLFQATPSTGDSSVNLALGKIECTSCHNPHEPARDAVVQKFLVRSNSGGAICLACHSPSRPQPNMLNGWATGSHSTATNTVPTTASFGPYGAVNTNACSNCHQQHGLTAGLAPRLLQASEEAACSPCHSGASVTPALRNVLGEFAKAYSHPTTTVAASHDAAEVVSPLNAARHAECVDCHNPHPASSTGGAANPPGLASALLGTSGYDGAGAVRPAVNEYQVCYKCHADSTNKPQSTAGYSTYGRTPVRVTNSTAVDPYNLRLKFASTVSRHNVSNARQRTAAQMPSLRANMLNLDGSAGRSLAAGTYIYCTDCHSNNQARKSSGTGPNGPHGSTWNHLLERRYDLEPPPAGGAGGDSVGVIYTSGINGTAGVCYKCHDIDGSIVQDASFSEHRKHIEGADTSCSTCHDPHGIHGGNTTNNSSLINFDIAVVAPPAGGGTLRFEDQGNFAGRCYLRCHNKNHNPLSY